MRPITTISFSLLLACGPVPPSSDPGSTGDENTTASASTTALPDPTTPTTTGDATSSPPPTTDEPTTSPTSSPTPDTSDFIVKHDTPILEDCDVWAQNCPPGHKCAPWADDGGHAWNATKCVEILGDGAPGEPCTAPQGGTAGIDDCALAVFCWDVDETNHGTCAPLCTGSADMPLCPPNFECALTGDGVINICLESCNPLLQDCPDDRVCVPHNNTFFCTIDASGPGGQANDPCEFANACDDGLACIDTPTASSACDQRATGCCQPFCKFPDGPCPSPDQACTRWFAPMQPLPPGFEDIGICSISG